MSSLLSVGRVGSLAAALGVGAGLALSAAGIAAADSADPGDSRARHAESDAAPSSRPTDAVHRRPARTAVRDRTPSPPARAASARSLPSPAARIPAPAANQTTDAASAGVAEKGITIDPTVRLTDGVVKAALNASSERGLPLTATASAGSAGGKITGGPQTFTVLPYGTWVDTGQKGVETFAVRVSEVTPVDQFLFDIPVVGLAAEPVISLLQQIPLVSDLLIPIIGASVVGRVRVDVGALAPGDTPVAFTYKVASFDGTPISTNFFPASGLQAGQTAPTVLDGPGLGGRGDINPNQGSGTVDAVPGVRLLREAGFNVVTWDPRGEFDSGGIMQLDNPFFEGRDTSAIISFLAAETPAALDRADDPKVGMVGASYGGGIQLASAGVDPRIEAVVPVMAWNSLNSSLYPYDTFKFAWANILLGILISAGARVNSQVYEGILTGDLFGRLSPTSQAVLASSGPTALLSKQTAPALLVQGTVDELFPLGEAVANARAILANPYATVAKMIWFCGGHGVCQDPQNPDQSAQIFGDTIAWMRQYVGGSGNAADAVPAFQWYDQRGSYFSSELLPFQDGFAEKDPYRVTGPGGTLGILPVIGGSNGLLTGEAANAVSLTAAPPVGSQIVGAPTLSFGYQGLGTSRAVFAQLVDKATGRVVGNNVSPIPIVLDGRPHTVSVPLNDIAYTVAAGDSLTLQITSSALLYQNWSVGVVTLSDIRLELPLRRR